MVPKPCQSLYSFLEELFIGAMRNPENRFYEYGGFVLDASGKAK